MTITSTDIKLLASERMTDTTDGGGRRTSNVIADGVAGNIFPKVSRLDSVYGRVNLRKVFGAVQTASLDTYAGAHAVIMQPPFDKNIVVSLFSTGSDFDVRTDARAQIESYVVAGPESRMILLGTQFVNQMAIQAYQRVEEPLPEAGSVLCLSTEANGVVTVQQFVRVSDVSQEVRTFTDNEVQGQPDFDRRVLTLKITTPLQYQFAGQATPNRMANVPRPTLIRNTTVADAARYYSIQPLAEAAVTGALTIKAASVYASIVPTTQRESPVSMGEIAGAAHVQASSTATLPYMAVGSAPNGLPQWVGASTPTAIAPGSLKLYLTLMINGSASGTGPVVTDDGAGNIVRNPTDNTSNGGHNIYAGTVDYATGALNLYVSWANGFGDGTIFASYTPAVEVSQASHTREYTIDLATRGTVWVETLRPVPAPGTLLVDYRALGKWYRLRDDGTGKIAGDDAAYGTGTIDYVSGAMVVTLGALPDVGSSIMLAWGSTAHYKILAGAAQDTGGKMRMHMVLPDAPVATGGTVAISYPVNGVTAVHGTDAVSGVISGDVTGTINYATGDLFIEFTNKLPDATSYITVDYKQVQPTDASAPTSVSGTLVVGDLTNIVIDTKGQALRPGQVVLTIPVAFLTDNWRGTATLVDDGNGTLLSTAQMMTFTAANGGMTQQVSVRGGQGCGTVNYATGVCSILPGSLPFVTDMFSAATNVWVGATEATVTQGGGTQRTATMAA